MMLLQAALTIVESEARRTETREKTKHTTCKRQSQHALSVHSTPAAVLLTSIQSSAKGALNQTSIRTANRDENIM